MESVGLQRHCGTVPTLTSYYDLQPYWLTVFCLNWGLRCQPPFPSIRVTTMYQRNPFGNKTECPKFRTSTTWQMCLLTVWGSVNGTADWLAADRHCTDARVDAISRVPGDRWRHCIRRERWQQ